MKKPQFSEVFNISMYFLNHDRNLQRITRLEENFVILIKKTKAKKKNSVCTVSYSMVKVACGDLVSSIYYVHMGVRMGVGKNWHALHFLTIT